MTDEDPDGTEALRDAIEQLRDRTEDLAEATGTETDRRSTRRRERTADPGNPDGEASGGDPFRDHRRRPLPKQREISRQSSVPSGSAQATGEVGDLRQAMQRYQEIADEAPDPEPGGPTTTEPAPAREETETARDARLPAAKLAAAFAVVLLLSPMGAAILPTQTFAVTTSAMAPTVTEGSLAILLEGGDVAAGDVIVYASPEGGERIRRVTDVVTNDDGTFYRVEADGQTGGPSVVVDRSQVVGVVVTHVPHLGVVWALPAPGTMLVFGGALAGYAAWVLRRWVVRGEAEAEER